MMIKNIHRDQRGASTVDYALIAALIGMGIVASLSTTGKSVDGTVTTVSDCLEDAGESCGVADAGPTAAPAPAPAAPRAPSRDRGNRVGPTP